MNRLLIISLALSLAAGAAAQTNTLTNNVGIESTNIASTNTATKDYGKYDLTLGGDGFSDTRSRESGFEIDVSLSTDPFKQAPNLWLGIDQGVGWMPHFNGSTDLSVYWAFNIWNEKIYFNPGWSGGMVYGDGPSALRTGPLAEFQYYVTDSVFTYLDINYDAIKSSGSHGLRYSLGIGFEF
jgi:hypothetical protein